jgi:hypothetical protein
MLFRALIAAAGNSAIPFSATGGTVTEVTDGGINYKVHTFTSSGTFTVVSGEAEVEYLVVAGGGGGGMWRWSRWRWRRCVVVYYLETSSGLC